jgi:hypothetical protein
LLSLTGDYGTLCEQIPEFKQFTQKEFNKMMYCVSSRLFGPANPKTGEKMQMLVPFADMANHTDTPEVIYHFNPDRKGFTLTAIKDIDKDKPIHYSYGDYEAEYFFRDYGFIPTYTDS